MARNPKPIRRHYREALTVFRKHKMTTGTGLKIRGHGLKELKKYRGPIKVYILLQRKVVKVSFEHWAVWFEYARNRILKVTHLPNKVRVSTVFLGLDHGFSFSAMDDEDYKPVVFETMIFGGDHDQYQERYTSYDEAIAGHQRAIEASFELKSDEDL